MTLLVGLIAAGGALGYFLTGWAPDIGTAIVAELPERRPLTWARKIVLWAVLSATAGLVQIELSRSFACESVADPGEKVLRACRDAARSDASKDGHGWLIFVGMGVVFAATLAIVGNGVCRSVQQRRVRPATALILATLIWIGEIILTWSHDIFLVGPQGAPWTSGETLAGIAALGAIGLIAAGFIVPAHELLRNLYLRAQGRDAESADSHLDGRRLADSAPEEPANPHLPAADPDTSAHEKHPVKPVSGAVLRRRRHHGDGEHR